MKLTRYTIQSCCGRQSVIFKIDTSLNSYHIDGLVKFGFVNHQHFQKAGILYVDNLDFIITGPLGSDRLQVKCKSKDYDDKKMHNLEVLLQQLG